MEFKLNPDGTPVSHGPTEGGLPVATPSGTPTPKAQFNPSPAFGAPAAQAGPAPGAPAGDLITEGNTENFTRDVMEASVQGPVIAYFTAPWCNPCKQLGPALEKAVRNAGGLVRMVKINVDENQQLAAQLRIQSVPTVYGFSGGQPVDAFQGAVPDSQIKAFIDKLTNGAKPPLEAALDEADGSLEEGDAETAQAIYQEVQAQDPLNERALAGMIRSAQALGDDPATDILIASLTPEILKMALVSAAISAVELAREGAVDDSEMAALEAKLADNENDHQARFDLAVACSAAGNNERAIDLLLDLLARDAKWNDAAAKQQLLKVFDALGFSDPLAQSGRKRMSTVMFS